MRVLPVIDLMGGLVVRGVGGRRDEYRPIRSLLCDQPTPEAVGQAFRRLGLSEAYLADLDAIGGAEPAWPVYQTLIECGLNLWIDAGLASADVARRLAEFSHQGRSLAAVVAGSETWTDHSALAEIADAVQGRLVFSLDLRDGAPLAADPAWRNCSPEQIAAEVYELGIRRFIVLDLRAVGMDRGVSTEALCRHLRRLDDSLEIVSGGGVRGPDDLASLAAAGCDAALVASALHDGRLAHADLHGVL
ncbi:MAG TPA: HisA/HisF-related TIM barrel protein [Pirellulales bacterium]|nr:HisA/HisF-related TIM barrel protein [Pirellulales bacterium]